MIFLLVHEATNLDANSDKLACGHCELATEKL